MAEIKEMNIENDQKPQIEEMRADNRVQITKVYIGGGDDFIYVSGNDISIIDRFLDAGNKLESLAEEMEKKAPEGEERDITKEIEERKEFSEKAAAIMDGVFGEGTTRKFFGDVYAVIPNFQPDLECFLDFWDKLIPVIERLSEHKIKLEKLASKQRMAKYQPQDHKREAK
ncbi:MAG: hypothetical protein NC548_35550 [Lachnospiraceae bacterium]|nr:hypothetical protein [Lachnospiraceae bacterium]MCM1232714.1 hypothetical protein [Ruminococcus flavefaciens]